jgi:ribonuclease P protein component
MKNVAVKENHLYNKAYSKGKRFSGRYVRVYVLKDLKAKRVMLANPEKKYINRLGISVSKKNGGAVVRNRIKRIIREGYRAIEREDLLLTGNLVIIAARNEAADVKSTDIERELRYAFKKLDMLKKSDSSEN